MTFQVVTTETPSTIVFVFDLDHDSRAGGFCLRIDGIRVSHDHIGGLRFSAADFIRLLDQVTPFGSDTEPSMIMPLPKVSCA